MVIMAKSTYTANMRVKMNGVRYKAGETLELTAEEAKHLGTAVQKGGTAKAAASASAPAPAAAGTAPGADPLDGVEFASPQAKQKAKDYGMDVEAFKHQRRESDKGFTVEDVDRIAEKATK